MTNIKFNLSKITKIAYGQYVQVYQKTVTNLMESRILGAIYLRPYGNTNGSYC